MKLQFVRFGGLSSVRQEGYDPSMPGFHSPPARRSIYAMVAPAVDYMLLSRPDFDPRLFEWVRDSDGRQVVVHDREGKRRPTGKYRQVWFFKNKDGDYCLARLRRWRWFTHDGEIWHRLPVQRRDVLAENGSWVFSDAKAHRDAFRKAFNKFRRAAGSPPWCYERDVFEVFIEKV